jgi:hypothetical protein
MVEIVTPDHGQFESASEWKDITLKQFEALSELEMPEKLRDLWIAASRGESEKYDAMIESISSAEHMGINAEYFRDVMDVLTTVPRNILDITEWSLVTDFYYEYLHQFVISTFYQLPQVKGNQRMEQFTPPKIKQFNYRDHTYYLPTSLHIFGEEIPMGNEKIAAFAEAADIEIAFKDMEEKGTKKFAVIVGIYCREKNQEYNQKEAMQRAEAFRNLDMETVWSVFFCILELYKKSMSEMDRFLKIPVEALQKKRSRIATWKISTSAG